MDNDQNWKVKNTNSYESLRYRDPPYTLAILSFVAYQGGRPFDKWRKNRDFLEVFVENFMD